MLGDILEESGIAHSNIIEGRELAQLIFHVHEAIYNLQNQGLISFFDGAALPVLSLHLCGLVAPSSHKVVDIINSNRQ